ncbi:MAG: PD-(D/E)XK nuclease family protein [Pseudomonadota bacterium]
MTPPRVHLLPPSADLCDRAAQQIVAQHRDRLPDLSQVTILLPSLGAAPQLRRALAVHAGCGLLGPQILTLEVFAQTRGAHVATLPALDCRLRLASALAQHRHLFPGVGHAQAADALFALFEDLIAHGLDCGDDETAFTARLQAAYRAPRPLHFLSSEAQIAHRLFKAYLQETEQRSPAAAYRQQLQSAFASLNPAETLYLLGFDAFSPAQAAPVKQALAQGRVELWLQGRCAGHDGESLQALCQPLGIILEAASPPASATSVLLDSAYSLGDADLSQPPLAKAPIEIVQAAGAEQEARCVDVAVREALLSGAKSITVISQDRKLARRLRALLERANVPLHDPVGWALSTSSAAACVNAWLECLASGFQFRPLLTFLKSAFADTGDEPLRVLEQDLVYGKGIEKDLDVFIREAQSHPPLKVLLEQLRAAAKQTPAWNATQSGELWCRSLRGALDALGLTARLQQDAAGGRLIRLLEDFARALTQHRLMLEGEAFRELLDRQMERETFVPDRRQSPVQLLTLEQSQNLRCDFMVVCGATRAQLPGAAAAEPLFNAQVRSELGLPVWTSRQALALSRLRRVLEAAPRVLITYAPESAGEEAVLSPWIEAVEAAAQRRGHDLRNQTLPEVAAGAEAEIALADTALPGETRRPAPATPVDLIPQEISATAHQALVDCPYQFFARSLLGLRPQQAPDEDSDRSEYGKRVHRILQAFTERVTAETRDSARLRLEEIAGEVFAPDLRAHALAQLWVAEFRSQLPALLDWLQAREPAQHVQTEVELKKPHGIRTLIGFADRLEIRADGTRALVDYKTGRVPKTKAVEACEAVQLLHYAALDSRIHSAEYLALKDSETSIILEDSLTALRDSVLKRLESSLAALERGAPLPAHGDDDSCEHCEYRGLCRKEDWRDV